MSYLEELNDIQRAAVTNTDGPILVIAGPGSGKTRVLTYRIAHLIKTGVPPSQILALTFTNKSAREMKARIASVVGDAANRVWAGTFHSIFAKILRFEAEKIGYPASFTIYDTQDSKSLIVNIVKEMGLDPKVYVANGIRSRISSAKSNLISPPAYAQNPSLLEQDRASKRPYIFQIYERYASRCKRSGAMDFDDLLYQMFLLLHKNPENVLEKYRNRFKYLLVDEFQDTNYLQYSIIRKLTDYTGSPKNICVVGDDAQSIYAFRGATIQNILDFKKHYPKLKTFKLEQNYRSTESIVLAANSVITHNKKQIDKTIRSEKGDGERIKILKTVSDAEEGKRVADSILELKTRNHLRNEDIAILYRTNAQSRIFEEYLRRHNIAYKVFGGLSFYQRKEIKDIIAYLRLTINQNEEESLRRVINYPKRGIGNTTVNKIVKIADDNFQTLWETIKEIHKHPLPAKTQQKVQSFVAMIEGFTKRLASNDAYQLATHIADKSGILNLMKSDTSLEGLNRYENLREMLDGIKEFVESDEEEAYEVTDDKTLTSYLQNIALLTDLDTDTENTDRVSLMTIHSAKGLEFPSVFVVGLEEQLFPSFMSMQSMDGIDEERRLFYVAITRAEKHLTLSYAKSRYHFGNIRFNEPSRFIDEIDPVAVDRDAMEPRAVVRGAGLGSGTSRFKRKPSLTTTLDPNFTPAKPEEIIAGIQVAHLRFGKGKVINVEGGAANKVATIFFEEAGQKRIMLKFAKLKLL